jgi:hypothetical protein
MRLAVCQPAAERGIEVLGSADLLAWIGFDSAA